MGVLPQSHLVRGFIHSCLQHDGKMKSSMCLLCVIKEERLEKIPMTFCCTCCLRKDMLSVARPHSMLILKVYMQKFETGGFIDPGRKSRFQTGAQKKTPFSSIFALALLMNGCVLPVLWFCPVYLLNLHAFYFWAIIVSRAGCKVGSWRATSSLPSSFSLNFWAWGLAFEHKFCDGDCRD